jgi:hypothetical protein
MSLQPFKEAGMAHGEGRTLEEAFEDYGRTKAAELMSEEEAQSISLKDATELFAGPHPVQISVVLRPNNQWVKGLHVDDT